MIRAYARAIAEAVLREIAETGARDTTTPRAGQRSGAVDLQETTDESLRPGA